MTDQPSKGKLIAVLCHTDDCCPEIFHDPDAIADCCIMVRDDDGNEAFFDPASLYLTAPRMVEQQVCLADDFGNEVYMQPGQYDLLFNAANREVLEEAALSHGVDMSEANAHYERTVREMKNAPSAI